MEVCVYEGASWLHADRVQRLHRVFKMHFRADSPEAAEVPSPNQQDGSLAHGSNIQLPDHETETGDTFL